MTKESGREVDLRVLVTRVGAIKTIRCLEICEPDDDWLKSCAPLSWACAPRHHPENSPLHVVELVKGIIAGKHKTMHYDITVRFVSVTLGIDHARADGEIICIRLRHDMVLGQ